MEEIYEKVLYIKNQSLFDSPISFETHKIFYKYTSLKYYKYIFNLLNNLCKKCPYENSTQIFHLSFTFILKCLHKCENTPYLSNLDLIILNCFSLGIKSLTKQKLFPSIKRLKKIYEEKYCNYSNKEILEGEIICLKLLNYNINILTPLEYVEYITYEENNIIIKKKAIENLENLLLNNLEVILYNTPFDIAKKCINEARNKLIVKEPKIITKKIISTKTFVGKNLSMKYSSSDKIINTNNRIKENINREILEKLKKKNNNNKNIYMSKYKQNNDLINNIQINIKCSPERIYYKKNCNCNIIHPSSSNSIIVENKDKENNKDNITTYKAKIFKKKISKNSVSKNKYLYKGNNNNININMNISNSKINEICHKKLYLNNNNSNNINSNNNNIIINKSYYELNSLNMSNTQYFRKTKNNNNNNNNINNETSKENDKNSENLFLQRNNSGNNRFNIKYSIESENVNNYNKNKNKKFEIETKNIKLGHLNKKYLYGSDYKKMNFGNRLTQVHSQLNSSGNFFENSNSTYSKDDNLYGSQSIGNYYIKW